MKLAVLHLSDIHIQGTTDTILNRAREIASVCFHSARETDACLILVTGDIAFGGTGPQYAAAERMLRTIRTLIMAEGVGLVEIFVAPGNHDCAIVPKNEARNAVIEKVISEPSLAEDQTIIDACTNAQESFFKFQENITGTTPIVAHQLWAEYEVAIKGKIVRVSAIHAARMSRVPEKQGEVVFPV